MIKKRKLILPGDKGWKETIKYPWNKFRKLAGLPEKLPNDYRLEIHGYFVKDNRVNPPIAIFKNCKFPLAPGTKPLLDSEPVPFSSIGAAYGYIKSLNLSSSEESKFKIAALAPDPGIGHPRPDVIFVTPDELKK